MSTLNFLLCLILNCSFLPKEDTILRSKTFFYDIYCKKRSNFYTVEMHGPKYYSIETLPILGKDVVNKGDTIAQNAHQSIVCDKKGHLKFCDKRWKLTCNLKEKTVTDDIKQRRLSLFYDFLETQIYIKVGSDKIPTYENAKADFFEYDKLGDIDKVVHKYTEK